MDHGASNAPIMPITLFANALSYRFSQSEFIKKRVSVHTSATEFYEKRCPPSYEEC